MLEICWPGYGNCIANLACSVLAHYGIEPPNSTLPQADALLKARKRNVVMLLLDGMGLNVLERHLQPDGFFRRHLQFSYLSTYPPTTVAAVTAVSSGLYPNQSAWLGWTGYFPDIDRNIVYFLNRDNDTRETIEGWHVANTFVPFEKLTDRIARAGTAAYEVAPFLGACPQTYDAFCTGIEGLCARKEPKFLYAYWNEPDHTMHRKGMDGPEITAMLRNIEERTERMAAEVEDTLLLITADHGMINTRCALWSDEPELLQCLVRPPSMEARAVNLFIKPGMEKQFEERFQVRFGSCFLLMSRAEVLERHLLGTGENHEKLCGMLGDYLAVATGDVAIRMEDKQYIGEHAGLTADEMTIPLIAVEKA